MTSPTGFLQIIMLSLDLISCFRLTGAVFGFVKSDSRLDNRGYIILICIYGICLFLVGEGCRFRGLVAVVGGPGVGAVGVHPIRAGCIDHSAGGGFLVLYSPLEYDPLDTRLGFLFTYFGSGNREVGVCQAVYSANHRALVEADHELRIPMVQVHTGAVTSDNCSVNVVALSPQVGLTS